MKKILITVIIVICQFAAAFSQTRADDVVGFYLALTPTAKEKFQVEIFRTSNGTYEAKVVWVENPEFRQRLESLQMRNILGISLFGRTMYWDKEMGLRGN